jgi:hypothetical protein
MLKRIFQSLLSLFALFSLVQLFGCGSLWIGHKYVVQTIYALDEVAIIIFTFHPAMKKHYMSIFQS